MGSLLKFVPFLLRQFQTGIGVLAGSSENNPKKSASLGILAGLLTLFGLSPTSLHSLGNILVQLGTLMKGF